MAAVVYWTALYGQVFLIFCPPIYIPLGRQLQLLQMHACFCEARRDILLSCLVMHCPLILKPNFLTRVEPCMKIKVTVMLSVGHEFLYHADMDYKCCSSCIENDEINQSVKLYLYSTFPTDQSVLYS